VTGIVLDASAGLALLLGEPARADVERQLRDRLDAAETVIVPSLFWLEVVNVLARRYRLDPGELVEAVDGLEQLGIVTGDVGRPMTLAVIDAVARSGLSAYDAAYLALAEASDAMLLTGDAALAAAAGRRAVLIGQSRRVTERRERYEPAPAWTRWRGAGTYLARLRAETD
jgi:predicted nucleic acid-binding protein